MELNKLTEEVKRLYEQAREGYEKSRSTNEYLGGKESAFEQVLELLEEAEEEAKVVLRGSPIPAGKSFEDVESDEKYVVIPPIQASSQPEADAATKMLNDILESYMPTPEDQAKDFEQLAQTHKAFMDSTVEMAKHAMSLPIYKNENQHVIVFPQEDIHIKLKAIIKPKTYIIKNKIGELGLICVQIVGCVDKNKEDLPILYAQPREVVASGTDIEVSDGYHTMSELYEHRNMLWITLCRALTFIMDETGGRDNTWKVYITQKSDEWFVLGVIDTVYDKSLKGHTDYQLSYHLPIKYLDECLAFARENPDLKFDGHTSEDVLERLKSLL